MHENQVPEGYMMDARGSLVPVSIIKEEDKLRDELVNEIVRGAVAQSESLRAFKAKAMADVLAFAQLSAEKYGVKWGGSKGNITLTSFDGRYKVVRSINEYVVFDERMTAAKELMNDCLRDWTSGADAELRKLVNFAFELDKSGKVSVARVMGLLKVEIDSPKWAKAMEAIRDAITVSGSKAYIRVYQRVGDGEGEYRQINLDVAAL